MTHPGSTRRKAIAGIAGSLVPTCAPRPPAEQPRVSILRAPAYGQQLYADVRRLLQDLGPPVLGKSVVLKPNLVEFDDAAAINTHPLVVHAALEAFRALGAAQVKIAEGPGHRRVTLDMAEQAGYFKIIPGFESLFTDLNLDEVSPVALRNPASKLTSLYLPRTVLRCDLLVSLPKMKTHHWAGATLSMKNLFGTVPGAVYGWPKNILHWAGIHECIIDLHRHLPHRFSLVDGIQAMEGNGPIQGSPRHAGVLVAGADAVAVDATCCRVMAIDPAAIPYLRTSGENVRQTGETIESVRTPFALIPALEAIRLRDT